MEYNDVINGATELREGRRDMVARQIKRTPQGDILFTLKIDMPGRVSEEDFKKIMSEYGQILTEAFR